MISSQDVRNYLNQATDYLIDWNRPGSLFFSTHRYSYYELAERAFVLASTVAAGFLRWNQSEQGGAKPFLLGASLGFLLAHTLTMSPLIYKRLHSKWGCEHLIRRITIELGTDSEAYLEVVNQVIHKIMTHNAEKSPSLIWGKRQCLLNNLAHWIETYDHEELSSVLNSREIMTLLDKNTCPLDARNPYLFHV